MAAYTVLATVTCTVKPLLKANGKKARTVCWILGCCTGEGECLLTLQLSDKLFKIWFELLLFGLNYVYAIRLQLETTQFFSIVQFLSAPSPAVVPLQGHNRTLRPSCPVWNSEGRCKSETCRPAAVSAAAHLKKLQQQHVPPPGLIHAHF